MVVTAKIDAWLLIADHYHARLIGCSKTPTGRLQLNEYGSIQSPIVASDLGMPIALADTTRNSYAERQRRLEEEYRRFARQLARWISRCIERFEIDHLTAFVPERSHQDVLSHLRHDDLNRVTLRGENLQRLSQDALSKHHLITGLLRQKKQSQTA